MAQGKAQKEEPQQAATPPVKEEPKLPAVGERVLLTGGDYIDRMAIVKGHTPKTMENGWLTLLVVDIPADIRHHEFTLQGKPVSKDYPAQERLGVKVQPTSASTMSDEDWAVWLKTRPEEARVLLEKAFQNA